MYMFTQCSRQLGFFFSSTRMFQAQIKGKYSLAPYIVHFPISVKLFYAGNKVFCPNCT